jgi:hypothetical protein
MPHTVQAVPLFPSLRSRVVHLVFGALALATMVHSDPSPLGISAAELAARRDSVAGCMSDRVRRIGTAPREIVERDIVEMEALMAPRPARAAP